MSFRNSYRRALVTGASSGIGLAIARELCHAGVTVFAVARNERRLQEIQSQLPKEDRKHFIFVIADLRKKADIKKIIETCKHRGFIDLLINNAGIGYNKEFEKLSDRDISDTIDTNLLGHVLLTKELLKLRKSNNPMHVVFVTSLAGKIGFGGLSIYSATKFALEGLCEALRIEYQNTLVSFTVLRPGVTDTNFFAKAGMQEFHSSVKGTKTLHPPAEVAQEMLRKINAHPTSIVVGNDKYFIRLLPFIPFTWRFKVLDIINKL